MGSPQKIGPLGGRLLDLEEYVVPGLVACLGIEKRVWYGGSEEAGLVESYQYRVKDLAAFYLSLIRDQVFIIDKRSRQA